MKRINYLFCFMILLACNLAVGRESQSRTKDIFGSKDKNVSLNYIKKIKNINRKFRNAIIQCSLGRKEALSIIVNTISKEQLDIGDVSFSMGFSTTGQLLNNFLYMYTGNKFEKRDELLNWWEANKNKTPSMWVGNTIDDGLLTMRKKAHIYRFTCNADIVYDLPAFKIWWSKTKNKSQNDWLISVGEQYIKKIKMGKTLKPLYHEGFNHILEYSGYDINIDPALLVSLKNYPAFIIEYWQNIKKNYRYNFINRLQ